MESAVGPTRLKGMHMGDAEVCEMVWHQFGASVTMLRRAIELCPTELWKRQSDGTGYWSLASLAHDLSRSHYLLMKPVTTPPGLRPGGE